MTRTKVNGKKQLRLGILGTMLALGPSPFVMEMPEVLALDVNAS